IIAHVDRRGHAMLVMQRWLTVSKCIAVLDVVVYERRFMKRLDGNCGAPHHVVNPRANMIRAVRLRAVAAGKRIICGERDERPRILAALSQEIEGDGLGGRERIEPGGPGAVDLRQPWSAA